ncbi:MAG: hypothetical protein QOI47_1274 [Actinomycetota bacterium]|nr:hypothetical protein [Actinomycetota bacterium]
MGRFGPSLGGIALFGFVVRVVYVRTFAAHIHTGLDTIWYQLVSATVRSGDGYVDPAKFFGTPHVAVATAFRPPLYPAFLAGVGWLVGGSTHDFRLAGCVAGVITVALIGLIGRRVAGDAVGLTAAAIASVYPAFLGVDAAVMSETVYVPLVTACVLAVYRATDKPTVRRWLLVGGLVGAAVLTRSDALALIVLLMVPAALVGSPVALQRRVLLAAAGLCACALVVTPWVVRNQQQLGTASIATLQSGTALAGANCPATYHGTLLGSWSFECARRADEDTVTEVARNAELRHDAKAYMLGHLNRLAVVVPVRILREWGLFDPIGEARLDAIESRNVRWQIVSWATYLPVAALSVYGFLLLRRRGAQLLPMLSVALAVTTSGALIYGGPRFRITAEPVLVVGAAVALVHAVSVVRSRSVSDGDRAASVDR